MENKKTIHVSGYVRNKKTETQADVIPARILTCGIIILVLVVYWKFTVSIATLVSLVVFAKKYYQFVNNPDRLMVNYFGASLTQNVLHNIGEMMREKF